MCVCFRVPTKQAQQVWSSVHLRHRHIWVFRQNLSILRPLELVKQLRAQHDIEILPNARHHFVDCILPAEEERKDECYSGGKFHGNFRGCSVKEPKPTRINWTGLKTWLWREIHHAWSLFMSELSLQCDEMQFRQSGMFPTNKKKTGKNETWDSTDGNHYSPKLWRPKNKLKR